MDLLFKSSLSMLPYIKSLLQDFSCPLIGEIQEELDALEDLYALIEDSIIEEPPLAIKEGGIIKDGYREDIDKYRQAKTEGKSWLADLEAKEKKQPALKT